ASRASTDCEWCSKRRVKVREYSGWNFVQVERAVPTWQLVATKPESKLGGMADVTRLLDAAAAGDQKAANELLPLVYDELRKLAAARMAEEKPGQTLQATALVHEAYLRLLGPTPAQCWDHRGHFFAAAAEAMRRILIDNARRKGRAKRRGGAKRVDVDELV